MWWLSTIGWQNNLCVFLDSGWWIVSGAFGWWDNCFQSSLWSNCASFHPCPPLFESAAHRDLKRSLGQRGTGQMVLPQRDVEEQQRFGWSDWLHGTHQRVFDFLCTVCLCVHLHVCVFSQLGLISEQEKLSEWLWGNYPQLHIQPHEIRQGWDLHSRWSENSGGTDQRPLTCVRMGWRFSRGFKMTTSQEYISLLPGKERIYCMYEVWFWRQTTILTLLEVG